MTLSTAPHAFRTYAAVKPDPRTWEEIRQVADEEQEAHDLAKLGLHARGRCLTGNVSTSVRTLR